MRIVIASLLLLVSFAANAASSIMTGEWTEGGVALRAYQSKDYHVVELRVTNSDTVTYGVLISTDLDNMQASAAQPYRGAIPAQTASEITLFKISCTDCSRKFYYRFHWRLQPGVPPFAADGTHQQSPPVFGYPWPKGETFTVDNGFNGYGAHKNQWAYAVDFRMPEGTPIMAAKDGTVTGVEARFTEGGNNPVFGNKANFVFIQHDDGTVSRYLHIRHDGVLVAPGQKVREGEQIGWSGNVGWTSFPHLHFDVVVADKEGEVKTIPFMFKAGKYSSAFEPKVGMKLGD